MILRMISSVPWTYRPDQAKFVTSAIIRTERTMKVELNRIDGDFHFAATGAAGVPVSIDAAEQIGGNNAGARPMELLLMGVGSCSAIDVILILKKQKQQLKDIRLIVEGEREEGQIPSVFTKINLHFILSGNLSGQKVAKADRALG